MRNAEMRQIRELLLECFLTQRWMEIPRSSRPAPAFQTTVLLSRLSSSGHHLGFVLGILLRLAPPSLSCKLLTQFLVVFFLSQLKIGSKKRHMLCNEMLKIRILKTTATKNKMIFFLI